MKQHLPPPRQQHGQGGGGTTRPLGRALKSGLWPSPPLAAPAPDHRPRSMGSRGCVSALPRCQGHTCPAARPGMSPLGLAGGPCLPPATLLPACLASLPGDQWRKHFLRKAGIFRWTMPDWPAPYLPHLISSLSPLWPNHTLTLCLQAKSPPPQPTCHVPQCSQYP